MKDTHHYVVCIDNKGLEASLEPRKIYVALTDPSVAEHGLIRVLDESGEDYLLPAEHFVEVELPEAAREAFPKAA
jgi:hypothetical protein